MTATMAAPTTAQLRQPLSDGLDVIVRRVPGVSVVATCLQYDVGFRDEPVSGLAHLTEHLLAGPWSLDPAGTRERFASGGRTNARTSMDYTQYTHVVPRAAFDLVLARERERAGLRTPSPRQLAAQVDVVRAELRRNVEQRPHGRLVMLTCGPSPVWRRLARQALTWPSCPPCRAADDLRRP